MASFDAPSDGWMALHQARALALRGDFASMEQACSDLAAAYDHDADLLLAVGALLADFGCVTRARACYEGAQRRAPGDLAPRVNLANLDRDVGEHALVRRAYQALVHRWPDHPVVRRNALISLEYDPDATDADRLDAARQWGLWAEQQAGGPRPRPPMAPRPGRRLRVGYVSADFCQHTVGLLVKDVLQAHDAQRVHVLAYSAGRVHDGITAEINRACTFRDVSAMDDRALADQIRRDGVDVLVDLSGHTAGSRLTVFAHRPAPVQVSWLGYFATTGLACMDAVLLDRWHAPEGRLHAFVEPVLALPRGRFCYQPVVGAHQPVSPLPLQARGTVTFGSFNHTAKLHGGVIAAWARVLAAVEGSRLVLKWRTFNDAAFREAVLAAFARHGIGPHRLELRGPSFHQEVLAQYADIDIALDPFPFTGGLTSCEALWMGVPVVTLGQSRAVSRQTTALLAAVGLQDWASEQVDDYVACAVRWARDPQGLAALRAGLRARMVASPLMDVAGFARQLESTYFDLFDVIERRGDNATGGPQRPPEPVSLAPPLDSAPSSPSLSDRDAAHREAEPVADSPISEDSPMPTIKIDNREFNTDDLSAEARQQLEMLVATENRLRELQRDLAITQTARNAYMNALKSLLPTPLEQTLAHGDVLKLG